jgi:hypothetical protein
MTFWLRGPTIEELRARGLGATPDYRPRPPLDLGPAPTPSADIGEERKCIVCSGAFTVTKTRKKTCSNACSVEQRRMRKRDSAKRTRRVYTFRCAGCERTFDTVDPRQKMCGRACSARNARQRQTPVGDEATGANGKTGDEDK